MVFYVDVFYFIFVCFIHLGLKQPIFYLLENCFVHQIFDFMTKDVKGACLIRQVCLRIFYVILHYVLNLL